MNLQTELIKEFAEVVHDVSGNKQRLSDNIVYGTLSKEGAHNYVKIDGSDLLTPVVVAASADSGDRVGVIIKNHTAIAGFNFSSPSVNTRTMENLVSTVNGKFDRIDATYITAEKANLTFATIQSLEAVDGKFDNLDTKFLTVESAKLQYATVEKLNATDAKVGSISGDFANFKNGEFSTLKAKQASFESATTENFKATNAKVDNLESTSLKASEAEIKYATIESLNATNAKVKNLDATTLKAADAELTYATIESLNALKGDITDLNVGSLTARVATIEGAYISKTETKQLLAGYADIKLANVAAGTIGSALIGDGAITDAKIASVSANKLTAGTIDASKINVTNLNADNLTVGTINGQRIGDKSIDLDKLSKEVPTKEYLDSVQNGLQNQIDSAIQTYTSDTIPTLKNYPAASWTDNSTRAKHVGDVCYVTNAGGDADGYCYRFTNTGTSVAPVYEWLLIKDSDVNRALQELVTVNGDISGLKTFQSETSSWRKSTDTEISSVKTRTTTIETTYSTKEETKTAADSAKTSAIESAKGYTDTAKTDAIASAKGYTDTATKDMATSTAVANAKKEAISEAAKDASSKASAAQSTAISEAAKDATSKADAAKSSAISAAASDATKKADAAKSSAISAAATDATTKANTAKSEAISAASSDATTKANTAKSEAISAAATDATTKANAALNSAKGYADDAVDNIAIGGRNLARGTSSEWSGWIKPGTGINQCQNFARITIPGDTQVDDSFTTTIEFEWCDFASQSGQTFSMWSQGSQDGEWSYRNPFADKLFTIKSSEGKQVFRVTNKWNGKATVYDLGIRVDYSDGNGKYRYRFIKAERGNKPTDWTPAPEDVDAAINTKVSTTVFNEVKQTVDSNSATITNLSETITTKADGSSVTALSNTVNSIKQTADSNTAAISGLQTTVSKKADSSTVETVSKTLNTVKQTADSNSANISELSKTVSTKADGSTVETLTNRVSTAEQNLDGFKTTVSKTYVTSQTYNEKVTNLESGISAAQGTANTAKSTADAATTTANTAKSTADTASKTASAAKSTADGAVSTANTAKNTADGAKSTADSAVNTANTAKSTAEGAVSTANSAKSSVDGLEIGGRNLWRYTKEYDPSKYNGWVDNNDGMRILTDPPPRNVDGFGVQKICRAWIDISQRVPIEYGQQYVLSAWIKWDNPDNTGHMLFYDNCSTQSGTEVTKFVGMDSFKRVSVVFTAKCSISTCRFECDRNACYWIYGLKLEKGNKPTDWTPAPEDDEERLSSLESWKSEASLKITKDGIIGTVGSYYATGADVTALTGRVTQAESTIKQQSDSIALTVKKDSVISAINQTSESVKISANKISLTAAGLVEIINSGDTKIKAANLNLSATDVVNIINSGTTKISADKLNLSGYVTVSSLSGSGTTTIDGSNIKTGKISTDRLDVAAIFAKEVSATNLHVTGNSKIDGNLVTSGINASNITAGTISADRLDVTGIFAKDVTATGTITGATLVGSSITTKSGNKGSVDIAGDTISAKYSYASNKTQEMSLCADGIAFGETVKNGNSASTYSYVSLDQNGLYIQDVVHLSRSAAQATFSCNVVATGLGVHGSADINNDLRVYGSMRADGNITTSTIELYAATPFIDFHFDGNNGDYTSRIIELESGKLNVNGVVCNSGAIWGTNIAIDGPGTFTKGITSKAESLFHTGSYTDPYPGKVCTIKSWGTVASLRFAAKGISNTWLGAAKQDGAAYDTICTDANALVPGWRVRTADGAWVGASYAQDPGFRIYYCNASRLAGSNNGTDAVYTFGASGTFHAKSVSQTSDEREKNILSGITEKYEKLFMRLKPILFNWKTGADGVHMGFGAQTTLELAEQCGLAENELAAVHKSETEEPWSMSYTEIVPLTVQMTQKVTKKTVEQDQKIKILESHIQMLQTALDQAFVEIAKLKKAVG